MTASSAGVIELQSAVAAWLDTCRSANTRAAYASDIGHFIGWCRTGGVDPLAFDPGDLERYRDECANRGSGPAAVARRLSAISSFSMHLSGAARGVRVARAARPPASGHSNAAILTDDEARALLAAADGVAPRVAVLIRLLMLDGLKVGEAVDADAADVKGRPPRVTLTLRGGAARTIALHPDTAAAIHQYVARRREGPLLLSEPRGREPGRLTRFGIDYLVRQVVDAAHLDRPVSGNALRRRYVIAAHADGAELDDIRRNAGHADERTTRRYLVPTHDAAGGNA